MGTLNVHLLDYLMTDDFIIKYLYPEDERLKLKVDNFASEFFAFYKGLMNDVKIDISDRFRKKNIGRMALIKLHELGNTNNYIGPLKEEIVLELQFSGYEDLRRKWERKNKNLILAHMEILYISCRRNSEYSFELFNNFEHTGEFVDDLLNQPNDSKNFNKY